MENLTPTMNLLVFIGFSLFAMSIWALAENTKVGQKIGRWIEKILNW